MYAPPAWPARMDKPYLQGGTARIRTACTRRPAGDRPGQLGHAAGACNAGVWAGASAGWDWWVHIGERGGFQLKVPHCPEWLQTVALVLSVLALIISFMR